MSFIELPNIKGSEKEQLAAVRSYLYQLACQLRYAFSALTEAERGSPVAPAPQAAGAAGDKTAEETFNAIKALIIKSSDIADAYGDIIDARLSGNYVAQSEYGSFVQATDNVLTATSQGLSSLLTDVEEISGDVSYLKETNAYFKVGLLDADVYGVEIGRTTESGGSTVFSAYARFLPNRLSFFDSAGGEIAFFSDYRLHVAGIDAREATVGGYKIDGSDGLTFLWIG